MTEKVFVTPAELSAMLPSEDVVLIDARDPATYAAGHLPGAVNIHDIFTKRAPERSGACQGDAAGHSGTRNARSAEKSGTVNRGDGHEHFR